ncbi:hypothetical protein EMIHUDRAFT_207498 [Emiliania huxleyi CCMP1516]|uniref:EF-hand domain-containing protein n=2 Tax=Emiliania huxleyi TaxID=2903 RepID=A0A0D3JA19_EMIH1|nr:hypothetical protein EMIHUDRAFT_242080 [Emiliania huxleyi CCMP1516]XP_005774740.1 hypothetical protein EMIHUDRAFT_207498 [Emiliania huxleyi CCMP1516]EOD20354.1 hypothetical protein EMIHUDRAFT_242080 [Emiliania huxleyi CCMP1516]EOD22311.1 hypothetical protein EMIHUDRAFT_207498 [Emiliania huxleyi CCMP1516]|eukprot:XP_005772783.1 hypothetical protein EMIHUDRAFT_242080 [Emiliania huxleyi CCMP1516]
MPLLTGLFAVAFVVNFKSASIARNSLAGRAGCTSVLCASHVRGCHLKPWQYRLRARIRPVLTETGPPRRRPAAYGLYSEEEIVQIHEKADAIFAVLDRNGDGEISEEELRSHLLAAGYSEAAVAELYQMLDANPRDGAVSRDELRESFVRYPPLLKAPGLGELGEKEMAALYEEADAAFAALDLDGNGSLSVAELHEKLGGVEGPSYSSVAVERIFDQLDVDGNGEISLAEFRGGYARYRAMRLALGSGFATGGLQL